MNQPRREGPHEVSAGNKAAEAAGRHRSRRVWGEDSMVRNNLRPKWPLLQRGKCFRDGQWQTVVCLCSCLNDYFTSTADGSKSRTLDCRGAIISPYKIPQTWTPKVVIIIRLCNAPDKHRMLSLSEGNGTAQPLAFRDQVKITSVGYGRVHL